jgi:hypothetical protein
MPGLARPLSSPFPARDSVFLSTTPSFSPLVPIFTRPLPSPWASLAQIFLRGFGRCLEELRSLALRPEGAPQARFKVASVLGLWLPPYFPGYSLFQAALVSEVRPRLFLSAGQIWNAPEAKETFVEVGGELWFTVEALGGLFQTSFVLGLAYPLLPEGPVLLYFGFGR